MSKQPEISVIIPVYGVENYIKKCLGSVLEQTFTDFECLIVDDGSLDSSIKKAKEVVGDDPRFLFLEKENGGQGSARNMGLDHARGEYIAFVDSDDYVEPDFLRLMYEEIVRTEADICTCDVNYVNDNNVVVAEFKNDALKHHESNDFLLSKKYLSNFMWDKLWRISLFDQIRFDTSLRTNEDVYVVFRLIYGKNVCSVRNPLYNYLQRPGATSKDIHPSYFQDRLKIKEKQFDFVKENCLDKGNEDYFIYSYLKTFVFFCVTTFARYSTNYKSDIDKVKKEIDQNIFTFKNILFMIHKEKKVGLSLLLFKISPSAFRIFSRFWFRNHAA